MPLVPCESCRRHLRGSEVTCPFCSARRTRSAIAIVAASSVIALAGCDTVRARREVRRTAVATRHDHRDKDHGSAASDPNATVALRRRHSSVAANPTASSSGTGTMPSASEPAHLAERLFCPCLMRPERSTGWRRPTTIIRGPLPRPNGPGRQQIELLTTGSAARSPPASVDVRPPPP